MPLDQIDAYLFRSCCCNSTIQLGNIISIIHAQWNNTRNLGHKSTYNTNNLYISFTYVRNKFFIYEHESCNVNLVCYFIINPISNIIIKNK